MRALTTTYVPRAIPDGVCLGSTLPGRSRSGEAFGQLVLPAVFKTDVTEDLGQAGSIPVRLR
jgi:hypothetical protein